MNSPGRLSKEGRRRLRTFLAEKRFQERKPRGGRS
jgi:hypothetical protein